MKKFLFTYILLSIVVIAVKLLELQQLENYLKPLLMPILMGFYLLSKKPSTTFDYKILFALLFSTIGDILLMPVVDYFLGGLMGFLIAHIFYISAFLSEKKTPLKSIDNWKKAILVIGIITYFSLLLLLYPKLDSLVLQIAIIVYASILLSLLIISIIRAPKNPKSSDLIVIGAFLFLLSDGMIALNKFVFPIPAEALFIMGTYTLAQALLVYGSLSRNEQ